MVVGEEDGPFAMVVDLDELRGDTINAPPLGVSNGQAIKFGNQVLVLGVKSESGEESAVFKEPVFLTFHLDHSVWEVLPSS
jgi:hypothetical protein